MKIIQNNDELTIEITSPIGLNSSYTLLKAKKNKAYFYMYEQYGIVMDVYVKELDDIIQALQIVRDFYFEGE